MELKPGMLVKHVTKGGPVLVVETTDMVGVAKIDYQGNVTRAPMAASSLRPLTEAEIAEYNAPEPVEVEDE